MLHLCDQGAARNTTTTKVACTILNFTLRFLFMISTAHLTPEVSVADAAGYSNSCGYTRGTDHTVATCLIADYHAKSTPFVTRLANVTFSHCTCEVGDDVIVLRHVVKQEFDTLVGIGLSLEHDKSQFNPVYTTILYSKKRS